MARQQDGEVEGSHTPYASDAQRRFFHTDTAKKHGITPAMVREHDQASKGKTLPKHSAPIEGLKRAAARRHRG